MVENLREQEAGMKSADVCRKHSVLEATYYKHKTKFGGMEVFVNTEMFCTPRRKHLRNGLLSPVEIERRQ